MPQLNKHERKALRDFLAWFFEKVRSSEELEPKLLELGFSKEYAKWRVNT